MMNGFITLQQSLIHSFLPVTNIDLSNLETCLDPIIHDPSVLETVSLTTEMHSRTLHNI